MSTPTQESAPMLQRAHHHWRLHLPTVPEALASLMQTVIVALFLLTFLLQPYLIPSESMEHTLLVGEAGALLPVEMDGREISLPRIQWRHRWLRLYQCYRGPL